MSSMIESFSSLFARQFYELLPRQLIELFNKDGRGTLSKDEITAQFLADSGLHSFSEIDTNHDGRLDQWELSNEIKRVVAESLEKDTDRFFLSSIGGTETANWVRSALNEEALGPEVLKLKVPTYLLHGTADWNTLVQPVYDLEKVARQNGDLYLHFQYFQDLDHQLTIDILMNSIMRAADRLLP